MVFMTVIRKMALAVPLLTFSSSITWGHEGKQEAKQSCQEDSQLSLEALRNQCEELKNDQQRRPFKINIMCNGSYTILEQGSEEQYPLPAVEQMTTEVTSKGGRYSTGVQEFSSESLSSVSCNKVTKTIIYGPLQGGIPVAIENCGDLEPAALEKICQTKLQEYCPDNMEEEKTTQSSCQNEQQANVTQEVNQEKTDDAKQKTAQEAPKAQGPQCSSTVEVLDTCKMYKSHK